MTGGRTSRRPRRTDADNQASSPAEAARENRLLALLPPSALDRLTPDLRAVQLDEKQVLFRANEPVGAVYFPITAVVSLMSYIESGESLEVGLIGRDGVVAPSVFAGIGTMPCEALVQVPGLALRMSTDVLRRELPMNEALSRTIARYAHLLLVRSMQMAACNMFHSVQQRCIRWLLTVDDLTEQTDIPLTHDLIATMLGVRRPTVSTVLGSLHRAGLVDEQRARIVIRNRRLLEAECCECYRLMRDEQRRLFGPGAEGTGVSA